MQDFLTCHWVGEPQRGRGCGVFQKLMNRLWLMSGDIIKMYLYIFKLRLLTEWGWGQRQQQGMGAWMMRPEVLHAAERTRRRNVTAPQHKGSKANWTQREKSARKAWGGGNERMSKQGWEWEWKWKFLIISSEMPQKVLRAGRAIYNIWKSAHSHG